MERYTPNDNSIKLREKTVEPEGRYEFIYDIAINAYNICQYLELEDTKEFCDLNVEIAVFERASLPFYTLDDRDVIKLMDAVLKVRDYIMEMLGENWEFRQMRELKDLEYLTAEEMSLYEGYVAFLNLSNAVNLKDFDEVIFKMEDSIYCLENCKHFANPEREKRLALDRLEKYTDEFSKKLAEHVIKSFFA